ncbi:MAG: hypothetical protein KA780_00390 [Prolixibacteraceae bacterium]|jgi:hypothetical protein|nr:hypothetical protein [Prolixibacteraceae bacterium]HNQ38001.1 hypothetical protein [Prolixibacteraceae bacterium]HPJ77220.1 hypothetical protein [Prolixibacteraceae bacterium]HRV87725.1 hypothetical protein [Prolixibacteraceae bacterium]
MKKLITIVSIFLFTSCDWIYFGSYHEHTAGFMFFDEHGNDLFADSLDLTDFYITSIKGSAEIAHIDTLEGVTCIDIFLSPDDGLMEGLFHFKDDVDTITASYTKHDEEIRSVIYNGVSLKTQSSTGNLYHIIK